MANFFSSSTDFLFSRKTKNQDVPLREYVNNKIFYGIKTGFNETFVIDEKTKLRRIDGFGIII